MWDLKAIRRIDLRMIPIVIALMGIGLFVISSMTGGEETDTFWTPVVKSQLRWYFVGWIFFFFAVIFDYRKLKDWSVPLYGIMILALIGLFLVSPIQNVHRWYRIPGLMSIQPSEQSKLILIMALSYFLERKGREVRYFWVAIEFGILVGIPFLLILKEPDLGTALILAPIALAMAYFAGIHPWLVRFISGISICGIVIISMLFSGIMDHEQWRPTFTRFMKDYQYERLNPNSYHQRASLIAISIGGITGKGWNKSEFSGRKWLPAAHTDSVFAAFSEEFGFIGVFALLSLFFSLIYFCFQVSFVSKDLFGKYLAIGLAAYLAMSVLVNIAMMCALLPLSGVPLIFITYGGSSILTTMTALGILQSIYSRRFMF